MTKGDAHQDTRQEVQEAVPAPVLLRELFVSQAWLVGVGADDVRQFRGLEVPLACSTNDLQHSQLSFACVS